MGGDRPAGHYEPMVPGAPLELSVLRGFLAIAQGGVVTSAIRGEVG
jgi:hypothetical protein